MIKWLKTPVDKYIEIRDKLFTFFTDIIINHFTSTSSFILKQLKITIK